MGQREIYRTIVVTKDDIRRKRDILKAAYQGHLALTPKEVITLVESVQTDIWFLRHLRAEARGQKSRQLLPVLAIYEAI